MPFDFDAAVQAPFRMQPGLRRVAPGALQLTPANPAHFAEKLLVLDTRADRALLDSDDFDPQPALMALLRRSQLEHPGRILGDRLDDLSVPHLGWSVVAQQIVPLAGALPEVGRVLKKLAPSWRAAALLALCFDEDLAIVDGKNATIPWLAVCLPSFWEPSGKVGRVFGKVHAPVADADLVRAAGPHLMRLVTGNENWERFVWTLTPHSLLRAHPGLDERREWPAELDADGLAAITYWRTERQTFIPSPEHAQAVFTIRVDRQPLTQAIDTPAKAATVHAALASMSDAVIEYRGLGPARPRLLDWLARQAG